MGMILAGFYGREPERFFLDCAHARHPGIRFEIDRALYPDDAFVTVTTRDGKFASLRVPEADIHGAATGGGHSLLDFFIGQADRAVLLLDPWCGRPRRIATRPLRRKEETCP